MIEYKAVAMDLDDTLLTSDLQISEETKQTLLQCQKDKFLCTFDCNRLYCPFNS